MLVQYKHFFGAQIHLCVFKEGAVGVDVWLGLLLLQFIKLLKHTLLLRFNFVYEIFI